MQHEQQARCARGDRAGARLAVEHGLLAKKGTPKPSARETLNVQRRHGFILAVRIRRAEALEGPLKIVVDFHNEFHIEGWRWPRPLVGVLDGDGARDQHVQRVALVTLAKDDLASSAHLLQLPKRGELLERFLLAVVEEHGHGAELGAHEAHKGTLEHRAHQACAQPSAQLCHV